MTVGVVCSYQHWKYRERFQGSRNYVVDEESGAPMMGIEGGPLYYDEESSTVVEDEPCIELRPVENLRIDKGASWTNPVKSSPYIIDLIPMYLGDVQLMGQPNRKTGEAGWDIPADSVLQAATRNAYDPTRQTREGQREDSKDSGGSANPTDFDIVWVHKNIMRRQGEDFCWYTLGTSICSRSRCRSRSSTCTASGPTSWAARSSRRTRSTRAASPTWARGAEGDQRDGQPAPGQREARAEQALQG
jgi:hypothetical protein